MTVKELIQISEHYNSDARVIMSKDMEGNDFSPLSVVESEYIYITNPDGNGEVYGMSDSDRPVTKRAKVL